MSNMGKGAGYYLTRSKSLLIDTAIVAILAYFYELCNARWTPCSLREKII